MSRYMFRASKGQDYRDPNNDKEGRERKKKEEHGEERITAKLHSRLLAEPGKEPR